MILYFRARFLLIFEIQYFSLFSTLASLATPTRKYNSVWFFHIWNSCARVILPSDDFRHKPEINLYVLLNYLLFVSFSMSTYICYHNNFCLVLTNYFTIKKKYNIINIRYLQLHGCVIYNTSMQFKVTQENIHVYQGSTIHTNSH